MTAERVKEIIMDCLYKPEELGVQVGDNPLTRVPAGALVADTVMAKVVLNPERIAKYTDEIVAMLGELPEQFDVKVGGGWTFLNACMTRDGKLWGEHRDINVLLGLGMACKHLRYVMPRSMWEIFPGGMPFFQVKLDGGFDTVPDLGVWDGKELVMTSFEAMLVEEEARLKEIESDNDLAAMANKIVGEKHHD